MAGGQLVLSGTRASVGPFVEAYEDGAVQKVAPVATLLQAEPAVLLTVLFARLWQRLRAELLPATLAAH